MSEILGPDGRPVEDVGAIAVPPGQAVDLTIVETTKLLVDGVRIVLEPGPWRLIERLVWERLVIERAQLLTERATLRAALRLPDDEDAGPVSRQVRRRALRDLRN